MKKLVKIFDNLYVDMKKAKGFKYYKRVPKKSGKGYNYFYTKEEYDKGKKEEKPKKEKGSVLSSIMSFFNLKDQKQAREKVNSLYSSNKDKLSGLDKNTFSSYMGEYLSNKDKWDKKFSGKSTYTKDKKTGKVTKKKAPGAAAPGGKQKWDTSLMKKVAGVVGGEMTTPKKEDIDKYKKEYKNLSKDELEKKLKDVKQYNEIEKIQAVEDLLKQGATTLGDATYNSLKQDINNLEDREAKGDVLHLLNGLKKDAPKMRAEHINSAVDTIKASIEDASDKGDKTPLMSDKEKIKLIDKVKKITNESNELGKEWNSLNKVQKPENSKKQKSIMKKRRSKRDQIDKMIDKLSDAGVFDEEENFSISDISSGRLPKSLREQTDTNVGDKKKENVDKNSDNIVKSGLSTYTKKDGLWSMMQVGMEGKGPFPNGVRITDPVTVKELDKKLKDKGDKSSVMSPSDKEKEKSPEKKEEKTALTDQEKRYDRIDKDIKVFEDQHRGELEDYFDADWDKMDPGEIKKYLDDYRADLVYDGVDEEVKKIDDYRNNLKRRDKLKEKLMGPKLFKATQLLIEGLEKAKKMPIGTVSNGRKKVAEGKWVPVSEGKPKKEKPTTDKPEKKKPEKKKEDPAGSNRETLKNAAKKIISILAEALSGKDVNQPTGQAVEAVGESVTPKQKPKPKKDEKPKKDDKNK